MYKIKLRLKEKRLKANITQKKLAFKCNISQSTVSRIERDLKNPNIKTLEKLSNTLNIHPLELLEIFKE
ncbi:helix-turn-helix transcriptional regulator [Clostridium botulinum C]|uniref:helix-turn-helix domain-containing protein n=1 Tax=Clostridium botulinum TaxID=1491 RepID=UPI001E292F3C|nr:helix-turn-helix transcriptional regulator [Clostridium botulinum]MCD3217806.1 helix-turn-helix transcriptional regulator [Clostridium botulinum C]